jgi:hypothetical protein
MSVNHSIIPTLLLPLLLPFASAQEFKTGYVPPTAEQKAAADARMITVTKVLPNRLALQRVAAERQNTQSLVFAGNAIAPAEDGTEISGFTGASPAELAGTSNLTASVMAYPSEVDNSAEPWFPVVGDQNPLGSCAAFSTVYYTMTSQVARLRGWNVKTGNNPAQVFSPKFIFNLINYGGDNGSDLSTPYDYMIAFGCATYADFPYDAIDYWSWPTEASIWRKALNYRMAASGKILGIDTEVGLAKAKQMLADGYVFNFCADVMSFNRTRLSNDPATSLDDRFFAAGQPIGGPAVVSYCKAGAISHAMTIVGYNDNLWCDINGNGVVDVGEKGALRLVNSWGPHTWGDGGFMWVSYDSLKAVSAVPGGFSGPRQPAIGDCRLDWLSARSSYTPSRVAEVTVTHARRNQMILDVGRGLSSSTTPALMGQLGMLTKQGGSLSFNGSTTPVAATFVLDCTELVTNGNGNRWFSTLVDKATDYPGTISSVRFTDSSGRVTVATTTNPSGGLPRTVDNGTAHVYADVDAAVDASPTVATAASATPNAAVGITNATLSVLGADDAGEASLTYTWATVGNPPGAVSFSANGSNAAKSSTVTFTQAGVYEFQCTIRDSGGRAAYSSVTVTRSSVNPQVGPEGYTWCAGEGGSFTLPDTCDVAYGANGVFLYLTNRTGAISFNITTFGSDPVPNVLKNGFYKLSTPVVTPVGPTGYTWCANEWGSFMLPGPSDVAYGGGAEFIYALNMSGIVTFTNAAFKGDPAHGVLKSGFYKLRAPSTDPVGPPGYTWCASEWGSFTLPGLCDLAYGGGGQFSYSENRTGTITFSNAFFVDLAQGVAKNGFYKLKSVNFAGWSLTNGLTGDVNGDADKDGIPNGIEYALQTKTNSSDGCVGTCVGNVISFKKRATASSSHGVSYCIEASKDLGVTDPWVAMTPSLNDETKIEAVMPRSAQKIFVRLRVVLAGATAP